MRQHRISGAPRAVGALAAWALALSAVSASAQILSSPSLANMSGPNLSSPSDANPTFQRFSNTEIVASSPSSFQTRYFGNVSADCFSAPCTARTETLNSNYRVSWTVTAPNIYLLTIATRRTAGLTIDDEGGNGAQATMGALGCTPVGGRPVSGGCFLDDPADNFAIVDTDVDVNQTNSLTVCGQSLGSPREHLLIFGWLQTAFTPGAGAFQGNQDSAAVRLGANNLQASDAAADYPGIGGRTQSNDGHFVTVSITDLCGNGSIDTCVPASEQCDDAALNGTAGSCCTTSCTFKANATGCTDDGNVCTNDVCNGASAICQHPNNTAPCTDGLFCNGADTCSGGACTGHAGDPCTAGSECADSCNESADNCFDLSGTPCSSDGASCTVDQCDGAGACAHPAGNAGTPCRTGSGDACDPHEACDGSSPTCPPDVVSAASVACRPAAGDCDVAENCTGVAGQPCPPDAVRPSTTVCRPAAGVCDLADSCDGVSNGCPADGFASSSTVCRPSAGTCDVAESCTASGASCPPDTGLPDTDTDTVCDAVDNCDTIPNTSQDNNDSDPLGDACDPCTNIVPTVQSKAKLILTKLLAPAGDDKLTFVSSFTGVPASPTIDPVTSGARFLIVDSTGAIPVDVTIPPGAYEPATKTGWKVNGRGTAWTYKDTGTGVRLVNGITTVQIQRSSRPGKYQTLVMGKNGSYPVNTANLPLVGTIVIDAPFAATGQCGEAQFSATPAGRRRCVAAGGGKTVKCR